MPFCFSPWTNLDISPRGVMSPCCKFQNRLYGPAPNISHHSLADYVANPTLAQVKQEFQQGQWPRGCERCQIEEQNGIKSKRLLDQERWDEHYRDLDLKNGNFITASVAFGNTCNLTCITCGPNSSSRWQAEHRHLWDQDIPPNHFYKEDFVDDFVNFVPGLVHLDIPGGEPFLSGTQQQLDLLKRYQARANQIALHYTTNATVWPSDQWWTTWQEFQEIDIQISLDAVGDRFEYIRYPADWQQVIHNIDRYLEYQARLPNLRLSVSTTVSAYNVAYLDEILDWCQQRGLPCPWLGRVHNPVYMRPTVWPRHVREFIADKLSQCGHLNLLSWQNMLKSLDDSEHYELFRVMTQRHDQYRKTNFTQVFPEIAQFI